MLLVDKQNEINKQKSLSYENKVVEVLCEDYDDKKDIYSGRDDRGRMIYFKSTNNALGEFVNVKIIKTGGISLYGELVG
jgi:tRNA A37 methylthiotransferase MiaB